MRDGEDESDNPEHAKSVDGITNARINSACDQPLGSRTYRERFAKLRARRGPQEKRRDRQRQSEFLHIRERAAEAIPHEQKGANGGYADVRDGVAFNLQGTRLLSALCARICHSQLTAFNESIRDAEPLEARTPAATLK